MTLPMYRARRLSGCVHTGILIANGDNGAANRLRVLIGDRVSKDLVKCEAQMRAPLWPCRKLDSNWTAWRVKLYPCI